MFKLIRRISVGVIPRPDRPWDEDPTSNAPRTNRKRRLSSTERDDADERKAGKKVRGETGSPSVADADAPFLVPDPPEADTKEVREVTQGVGEVELEDKSEEEEAVPAPETIPLPEEKSGELDELASDDDVSEPTDDAEASKSGKSESAPEVVVQSASTTTEDDSEELKHDEDVTVKEKPTSAVAAPTNDANPQRVSKHP